MDLHADCAALITRAALFGLTPYDPITLIIDMAVLSVVALGASHLPTRRAVLNRVKRSFGIESQS